MLLARFGKYTPSSISFMGRHSGKRSPQWAALDRHSRGYGSVACRCRPLSAVRADFLAIKCSSMPRKGSDGVWG